jgi:hypothetical protein
VSNATNLGGHAAAYFLPAAAKAADSAMLNGHTEADFLGAGATAVNSSHRPAAKGTRRGLGSPPLQRGNSLGL